MLSFRWGFLAFALLILPVQARPIADYESPPGVAVHKGQTSFIPLANDFPDAYLTWPYQRPEFIEWFLSYQNWEAAHLKYFRQNYGENTLKFRPSMIVMHYTVVPTAEATYRVLQRRRVTVHFMVDTDGTIYQLMPLDRRCTGAYGVNHKAISIEMVATDEYDLLSRPRQLYASFCLAKYLMANFDIRLNKVVGHYEVGAGVSVVPDYLDLHDRVYPTNYPPHEMRYDPGETYMRWLRTYLQLKPPGKADL